MEKPKVVYRNLGEILGIPSKQEPQRVYDGRNLDNYPSFQCLVSSGGMTTFSSIEDLIKVYPHLKDQIK